MPATRHRFGKCGHKGFGGFCHRCAQADALEKKLPKASAEAEAKMKVEIARLRQVSNP